MATDHRGNKARGEGMYVYNMAADTAASPASVKRVISKGWGSLLRSKTYRETTTRDTREKVATNCGGEEKVGLRKTLSIAQERRSVSQVEVNVGSVVAFLQVKVLTTDMPEFMQVHAFRCARRTYDSMGSFSSKHMAYNMKKEFDKVYGPAWHCIVGSSFGSFVTHATGCFLYFSMENLYMLLFKTKVQRALLPQI